MPAARWTRWLTTLSPQPSSAGALRSPRSVTGLAEGVAHPLLVAQVAGTGVTTFVYMVARGDGLFYPSKVGQVWPNGSVEGTDASDFEMACYWRAPPTPSHTPTTHAHVHHQPFCRPPKGFPDGSPLNVHHWRKGQQP